MANLLIKLTPLTVTAMLFCGCSDSHPAPPVEQIKLAAGFFHSLETGNSELAIRQGKKLRTLDAEAAYLDDLISIQETNGTMGKVQQEIRKQNIPQAEKLIKAGLQKHPDNQILAMLDPKIRQLRNAKKLFRSLARARNASAIRGARTAIQAGLSLNMTPQLEKFLKDYELHGAAVAAREKENALARERAAQEAALRAKAEEKKRLEKEKQFLKDTAAKTAEGEKLRGKDKVQ